MGVVYYPYKNWWIFNGTFACSSQYTVRPMDPGGDFWIGIGYHTFFFVIKIVSWDPVSSLIIYFLPWILVKL